MSNLGQKNGHKSHKSDGVTAPLIPMEKMVIKQLSTTLDHN